MTNTTKLNLPLLDSGQENQIVVHNEAISMLDALWQLSVISMDLDSPPVSPSAGDTYIVKAPGYGAWEDMANYIAAFVNGAWQLFEPSAGWRVYDNNTGALMIFDGADWVDFLNGLNLTMLGINATPDSTNRLSVKSEGILFDNDGDSVRLTLNKNDGGDDSAIIFQRTFLTRALMGLLGDEDWTLKVTPDEINFYTAISIDKDTGHVGLNGFTADTNNALGVKGTAFLFDAETDDCRFTFNKAADGDDAALTFQSGYSGRALVGLLGDNQFKITVSDDGSSYTEALIVDETTGAVTHKQHPKFSGYCNYDQYNSSGAWFTVDINNTEHNDQAAITGGVFTAPHDGYFTFGAGCRLASDGTPPTSMLLGFSINNADPLPRHTAVAGEGSAALDSNTGLTVTACLKLTAGDTVRVKAYFDGEDSSLEENYSFFWGAQVA